MTQPDDIGFDRGGVPPAGIVLLRNDTGRSLRYDEWDRLTVLAVCPPDEPARVEGDDAGHPLRHRLR